MENINWKIRLKNSKFWLGMIPAICLLLVQVGKLLGFDLDLNDLNQGLCDIVLTLFSILTLLGVVNDPTTAGLADSKHALQKQEAD